MYKFVLSIVALAAFCISSVVAQNTSVKDITGVWQGTLQADGGEHRMVFKISKAEGGGLKAVVYPDIDESGQGQTVGPITLQNSTLKMSIPGPGAVYEGKLDTDGVALAGTITLQGQSLPLNLKLATTGTAWTIPDPPARLKPMVAESPEFAVATIKPSRPDGGNRVFGAGDRQFTISNASLSGLIAYAWDIHQRQIAGGPAWFETEKFDIVGQPDGEGRPSNRQWRIMLQKLLADRFKFSFHRDRKEIAVYELVVGNTGTKLVRNESSPNDAPDMAFRTLGILPARNASMGDFTGLLQRVVLDRPVLDRTGLPGRYDFNLEWTPNEFQFAGYGVRVPPPVDNAAAPPDLFTALQRQTGLKLESTKAMVEVLIVDHVEKPSGN